MSTLVDTTVLSKKVVILVIFFIVTINDIAIGTPADFIVVFVIELTELIEFVLVRVDSEITFDPF